jgi:hypothetical protein
MSEVAGRSSLGIGNIITSALDLFLKLAETFDALKEKDQPIGGVEFIEFDHLKMAGNVNDATSSITKVLQLSEERIITLLHDQIKVWDINGAQCIHTIVWGFPHWVTKLDESNILVSTNNSVVKYNVGGAPEEIFNPDQPGFNFDLGPIMTIGPIWQDQVQSGINIALQIQEWAGKNTDIHCVTKYDNVPSLEAQLSIRKTLILVNKYDCSCGMCLIQNINGPLSMSPKSGHGVLCCSWLAWRYRCMPDK